MVDEEKERRRFQRIFFSLKDEIIGIFSFPDLQRGVLAAHIINVSEGGMGLVLNKEEKNRIKKGDQLTLAQVRGIKGLESLRHVEVEIKWILDNPSLELIGFGCEFVNFTELLQDALRVFIDSWYRLKMGEPKDTA
ncbi:MAG: PilZ domain-containing protein [Deltaproteobacteria bacterium]|nr:PilZ domain-containing protein [Deltaproteobacteria bacterium]